MIVQRLFKWITFGKAMRDIVEHFEDKMRI
jgi:hypothetical protein